MMIAMGWLMNWQLVVVLEFNGLAILLLPNLFILFSWNGWYYVSDQHDYDDIYVYLLVVGLWNCYDACSRFCVEWLCLMLVSIHMLVFLFLSLWLMRHCQPCTVCYYWYPWPLICNFPFRIPFCSFLSPLVGARFGMFSPALSMRQLVSFHLLERGFVHWC